MCAELMGLHCNCIAAVGPLHCNDGMRLQADDSAVDGGGEVKEAIDACTVYLTPHQGWVVACLHMLA